MRQILEKWSKSSAGVFVQWFRNVREKVTFRHLFYFNQIVLTLVLVGVLAIFGSNIYTSELVSLREKFEPLLSREVEQFNYDFRSLESNVDKLKIYMDLYALTPVKALNANVSAFAAKTLAPHTMQYNAFFAFGPELSRKYFGRKSYVLTVHRDYSLYGTEGYSDSSKFVTRVFLDEGFLGDPSMEWWSMNKLDREIAYSKFYFDKGYMEKVMFTTATGVFVDGKLAGVVGIDTLASDFASRLDSFHLGQTGGLIIVDDQGRPLVPLLGSDTPIIGYKYKKAANEAEFKILPTLTEKVFEVRGFGLKTFYGSDGAQYLTISKALKGRPWHLVLFQQRNEAFASLYQKLFLVLATSLAAYVALSFIMWLSWRYMVYRNSLAFRALKEARDRAEAATRAKSAFLSTMSHEIRTPLNAMLGVTELLSETSLDKEQNHYVRTLQNAGDSLLGVLNNVLDFSKIESGHVNLETAEFRFSDLMRETQDLCSISAQKKKLEFVVSAPSEDHRVAGDFHRLKQILLNLIGNAIKFTPRGKIELALEVVALGEKGINEYRLAVRDTGVGISRENLSHIFEDFHQEDSSITRRFGGTGLGLSISRKLVQLMGSEISCLSEINKGSEFSFSLKLRGTAVGPWPKYESILPPAPSLRTDLVRILIVDDMDDNHNLIRAYFKKLSFVKAESAYDGDEALRLLRESEYQLVLMDVQMPNMDGLEAIRRLRRQELESGRVRTPVVVISANSFREDIEKSLQAGADEHCGKPIRKDTLLALVEKYCISAKDSVMA